MVEVCGVLWCSFDVGVSAEPPGAQHMALKHNTVGFPAVSPALYVLYHSYALGTHPCVGAMSVLLCVHVWHQVRPKSVLLAMRTALVFSVSLCLVFLAPCRCLCFFCLLMFCALCRHFAFTSCFFPAFSF